jgi:hypothetical protein
MRYGRNETEFIVPGGILLARFRRAPVQGHGVPGYRFAQPGTNVLAALSGCW